MGSGIAEVNARAGISVVVVEVSDTAAEAARDRISASLQRAVDRNKLTEADRDQALDAIVVSTSLEDLADRQLVVEAASEKESIKLDLFTPMFAMSRIAGWSGHIFEQLDGNRLYRPTQEYIGPHDVAYVPLAQR